MRLLQIPVFRPLATLVAESPKPAVDYRVYSMREPTRWGYAVLWVHTPTRVMIFGTRPRLGDVVVSDSVSGKGLAFVVTDVTTPVDPGDQHFASVSLWGRPDDLPGYG